MCHQAPPHWGICITALLKVPKAVLRIGTERLLSEKYVDAIVNCWLREGQVGG